MINFHDLVPSVYSLISRDFQYLSWLINIVLNSVKHNIDDLYYLPNTQTDSKITELLAMTLGFKVKRNYNQKQLIVLVSIIPDLLRYKGTKKAIQMAGDALVAASGSEGSFICNVKNNVLEVTIPKDLVDITLFTDLLPYILPAGMSCKITKKTQKFQDYITEVSYSDRVYAEFLKDLVWDDNLVSKGLAALYTKDSEVSDISFANFKQDPATASSNMEKYDLLNTGLLDNTIIPTSTSFNSNAETTTETIGED